MEQPTFEHLVSLADRELRLARPDPAVWKSALAEARDQPATAEQHYWRLRAQSWRNELASSAAPYHHLRMIEHRIEEWERQQERQRNWAGWGWAALCFAAIVCTYIFARLALIQFRRDSVAFGTYAVLTITSLVLIGVGWVASQRHSGNDL